MIDKKDFLSKFNPSETEYTYMIESLVVIDSRPPYTTVQVKKTNDVDDLYRLYEEIKLSHTIELTEYSEYPCFKLKETI